MKPEQIKAFLSHAEELGLETESYELAAPNWDDPSWRSYWWNTMREAATFANAKLKEGKSSLCMFEVNSHNGFVNVYYFIEQQREDLLNLEQFLALTKEKVEEIRQFIPKASEQLGALAAELVLAEERVEVFMEKALKGEDYER